MEKKLTRRQAEGLAEVWKTKYFQERAKVQGLSITFDNFGKWIEQNLTAEQKASLASFLEEKARDEVQNDTSVDGGASGDVLDDTPKIWTPDNKIIT